MKIVQLCVSLGFSNLTDNYFDIAKKKSNLHSKVTIKLTEHNFIYNFTKEPFGLDMDGRPTGVMFLTPVMGFLAPRAFVAVLVFCRRATVGLMHCSPMRFDMRPARTVCMDVASPNLYDDVLFSTAAYVTKLQLCGNICLFGFC